MKSKSNFKNNQRVARPTFFKLEPQGFQKYLGQKVTCATVRITQDYMEKYLISLALVYIVLV